MRMLVNLIKELVIGAGTDDYVSYSQKGSHDIVEGTLNAILELYQYSAE